MMRVAQALDMLRDELPNTFVNFVPLIDITITLVFITSLCSEVTTDVSLFRTCMTNIHSVTSLTAGSVPVSMEGLEGLH